MFEQASSADKASSSVQAPSPSYGLLRRIAGNDLMNLSLLSFVSLLFSDLRNPVGMLTDPDIWWHIANGRIVDQARHFIRIEPYSFTVQGQPWIDPEWLSGLIYWLAYKHLALVGIYLVAAACILGNVFLVYARSCMRGASGSASLWISALGVLLMSVNASARMILFGYILLSLEMAIIERDQRNPTRLVWLLPSLFCLWINLHGTWVIGLSVFVLYAACGWVRFHRGVFAQERLPGAQRIRHLFVIAVSLPMLFLNPYGWRLLWNPVDMALGQKLNIATVQEWQPLSLNEVVGKFVVLSILLLLVANCLRGHMWKLFDLMLVVFAWYSAFAHARFTFLAAVLVVPVVATDVTTAFSRTEQAKHHPMFLANVVAALGAIVVFAVAFPRQAVLETRMAEALPLAAIAHLQPEWRTFNQDGFGGPMDFESKPAFIDSRFDTFEHHGVMKDYLDIIQIKDSIRVLDRYRIDHVLIQEHQALAYLLEHSTGWRVVQSGGEGEGSWVLIARTPLAAAAQPR
ncbi:MAG TPA: hypothetical protein VE291_11760 [Terracidiphilus sp.]|nr:hypothetical protein [Terracidiphilus sp.]